MTEPHVNAAVMNTSIPADEKIFAQNENKGKGRGNVNGILFVAFRVTQIVIACSTKIPWISIRTNYAARQILPIKNLFECNSYRNRESLCI